MRIVIAGAGGHGREIYSWIQSSPGFRSEHHVREIVFVNDVPAPSLQAPIVDTIVDFVPTDTDRVIVAIGDPPARAKVVGALAARGAAFLTFVHDDALVAPTASLADGVVICPRAVVSTEARLGAHVHVNVGAVVSHDATLADFCTLSPASIVLGGATVGAFSFIGAGAVVLPRTRVGAGTVVGAQAAVTRSVADGVTVVGVPAGPSTDRRASRRTSQASHRVD